MFNDLTASWRRAVRTTVLEWYARHGRELPWRLMPDPYRIWVSEIMLQQTTVTAVIPYFDRFMKAFPTVRDLADADESEVLKLWEGLGYYSRARNLHRAARQISVDRKGVFPSELDDLQRLSGIGRYAAGAIRSFAFNLAAPIVEANTARLYARLTALRYDIRSSAGQKHLWSFAEWLVDPRRPGDFNQAVMDIGSRLCTPVNPECRACPLLTRCETARQGLQQDIPVLPPRKSMTDTVEVAVAVQRQGRWLLRQRGAEERWAGLWDFVRFAVDPRDVAAPPHSKPAGRVAARVPLRIREDSPVPQQDQRPPHDLEDRLWRMTGLQVADVAFQQEIRHVVTRFRITLLVFCASAAGGRIAKGSGFVWRRPAELASLGMPVSGRRIADMLDVRVD